MDVISVLREVETWSLEDRVLLASRIWDHLIDEGVEPEISEEQRIELDRRLAADESTPDDVVSWDEVRNAALARART